MFLKVLRTWQHNTEEHENAGYSDENWADTWGHLYKVHTLQVNPQATQGDTHLMESDC